MTSRSWTIPTPTSILLPPWRSPACSNPIVYIGGITEMKKVCALAETYQVVIAPHNTKGPVGIMAAAHVMAAIPNPLIQEFIAPSRIPWRNDVLRDPLIVEDSCLVVPDRPGLGVEFDEAALKPHLVE